MGIGYWVLGQFWKNTGYSYVKVYFIISVNVTKYIIATLNTKNK